MNWTDELLKSKKFASRVLHTFTPLLCYLGRVNARDAVTVEGERGIDTMIFKTSLEIALNLFHVTGLILYPLKTSENQRLSGVFRMCEKNPAALGCPRLLKKKKSHDIPRFPRIIFVKTQ